MQNSQDWNANFNREEEIMLWSMFSNIYFQHYEHIKDFKELRKKYLELWDEPDRKPLVKRAIKYFYLFRRAVLEKGDGVGLLFENRIQLTQKDVDFYYENITNPLAYMLLNTIVESDGYLDFSENIILHLGADNYYPPKD